MGHYDSCYEAEAAKEFDEEWNGYTESIEKSIDKMDIYELRFLADVAKHIKDYQIFFKVLKKNIK